MTRKHCRNCRRYYELPPLIVTRGYLFLQYVIETRGDMTELIIIYQQSYVSVSKVDQSPGESGLQNQ
jgi:hypothetical protein